MRYKVRFPSSPPRPRYASIPVDSFRRMEAELAYRERKDGGNIPKTVGILIADYRRQFCKENIINQLERIDKKSGPLIDFYIPGYFRTMRADEHQNDQFEFKQHIYCFNKREYDRFVRMLERRRIKVTGRTQLLLVPYENHRLWLNEAIGFDLEKEEETGKIESTKLFFDFIIDISKKTTDFEEFKQKIQHSSVRAIFLDFLKEKLPDTLWSLLTTPFSM